MNTQLFLIWNNLNCASYSWMFFFLIKNHITHTRKQTEKKKSRAFKDLTVLLWMHTEPCCACREGAAEGNRHTVEVKVWPLTWKLPVCVRAVPPCVEVKVSNQTDWCWGPIWHKGPALLQILINQLAASQETDFNYHKSLGLFPSILFFNWLCM